MKHKILLLLFLFSLLPSWGWGQENEVTETIDFANPEYKGGFTIEKKGTYIFKGTYTGTPAQVINGENGKAVINVAADLDLEVTIILDNAKIDLSAGCPLSAKDAKMVNLKLKRTNTLIGRNCPGIWAPEGENCGIIIDEESGSSGSLIVETSSNNYPGIGGEYNQLKNGYITINGGTINATANFDGAGIGSGSNGSGCEITINGGIVNAASDYGAGIGSGYGGSKSKITITGGTVNATSSSGAGISSGEKSTGSNITITGGTVNATSVIGAGIGDGNAGSGSTFFTGDNGTAFINASSISDPNYKDKAKGLIFDGSDGAIYGVSYTLTADAIIESRQTLTINDNQTLNIEDGVTLVNKGTINSDGTITNNGKILLIGSGKIEGKGLVLPNQPVEGFEVTCNLNYDNSPEEYKEYVGKDGSVPDVKRDYYEFLGWYTQSNGGEQVKTIKGATIVYAHWKPIDLKPIKPTQSENLIYGNYFESNITTEMLIDNIDEVGGIKSIELITNNLFNNLSFNDSYLKGVPIKVGKTEIIFKITAINDAIAEVSIEFNVIPASLTIAPGEPITKVYDGNNTVTTPNALKLIGIYSDDDVHLDPYKLIYDDEKAGIDKEITNLGSYTLTGEKKDNYNLIIPPDFALKGTITQAPLTITPKPNQKLFEDETPAYEVIGEVNDETPKFTGSLGVESGKVVINSLFKFRKFNLPVLICKYHKYGLFHPTC